MDSRLIRPDLDIHILRASWCNSTTNLATSPSMYLLYLWRRVTISRRIYLQIWVIRISKCMANATLLQHLCSFGCYNAIIREWNPLQHYSRRLRSRVLVEIYLSRSSQLSDILWLLIRVRHCPILCTVNILDTIILYESIWRLYAVGKSQNGLNVHIDSELGCSGICVKIWRTHPLSTRSLGCINFRQWHVLLPHYLLKARWSTL